MALPRIIEKMPSEPEKIGENDDPINIFKPLSHPQKSAYGVNHTIAYSAPPNGNDRRHRSNGCEVTP